MASKAMILLLLTGHLLVAQTFAQQDYNAWQRTAGQPPQLGVRSLPSNSNWGQPANPQPLNNVEEVNLSPRPTTTPPPNRPPPSYSYMDRFSAKLFQKIVRPHRQDNVVFSPFSVHALLGMIYAASAGKTKREVQEVGEFGENQIDVALDFERLVKFKEHLQGAELTMAMRVFYNQQLGGINPSYDEFAKFYYDAGTQPVNMDNGQDTSSLINAWVADRTHNKIQNLVRANDINSQMQALLVNAVYFMGRWEHEFSTRDTQPAEFRHTDGTVSQVAMMFNDDVFGLADLPELNATALELSYKNSATSMLILLPNRINGLADLEQKLAQPRFDLNKIAHRLRRQTVSVRLPKFRIEFEQDMTEPLKELGIRQMFTPNSQVIKLLDKPVRVEKILQKAYIDVGEGGTEASAASYAKFVPLSLPVRSQEFVANRPFVFAIRAPNSVLFVGHVERPTPMTARNEPIADAFNRQ
ncbi:alaserpin [Drosophila rhopaloa]|uniref:Serpin domain-containing protein n=1 Tax=Drosophila rhopaloa TaxID=1041015 RepID=A0ABM5I0U8_DRORH|nr:alaserpin [Drosophila rhopaloa]